MIPPEKLDAAKAAAHWRLMMAIDAGEPQEELWRQVQPNGSVVVLLALLLGASAIAVLPFDGAALRVNYWRYADLDSAWQALVDWDGTGEPNGWVCHPASGRRREAVIP